ncbi:MAG: DNA recombination protein RmuC [Mycobacteriales bacterium]
MLIPVVIALVLAAAAGAVIGVLVASSRGSAVVAAKQAEIGRLEAELDYERRAAADKVAMVEGAQAKLAESFSALSADALRANNQQFLELANASLQKAHVEARGDLEQRKQAVEHLVAPLRESLVKVENQLHTFQAARQTAEATMSEQVRALVETQDKLRDQTKSLADALRAPNVRGRWGEVQLRRVVELAGMVNHCDFVEQATSNTGADGGVLRPDLVVKLPGHRNVVVDSKVPLVAYLEAAEAPDDATRKAKLREHAKQLRSHIDALSAKEYWTRFDPCPDYVILFIPGEAFLADALDQEPGLMEYGFGKNVILAGPTTLIAHLKAIALGWREEALAENAQQVCDLGKELYERLSKMGEHVDKVGRNLDRAVGAYNDAVGTLEGRVFVTARKFKDLSVVTTELEAPTQVEKAPRSLQAGELVESRGEAVTPLTVAAADDERVVAEVEAAPERYGVLTLDVTDEALAPPA